MRKIQRREGGRVEPSSSFSSSESLETFKYKPAHGRTSRSRKTAAHPHPPADGFWLMDFGTLDFGTPNNVGHARPEIPSRICVKEEMGGVIFSRKSWDVPLNWIFFGKLGNV